MAEKKGEGGGGNPRSSKSSTSSRKLAIGKKLADKRGNEQECSVGYILDQTELLLSNKMSNKMQLILCHIHLGRQFGSRKSSGG